MRKSWKTVAICLILSLKLYSMGYDKKYKFYMKGGGRVQRTLRQIAAGLVCFVLLGGSAVFAEEEATAPAATTPEMKAVVLQSGQDFDPAAGESECKAQLDAALARF